MVTLKVWVQVLTTIIQEKKLSSLIVGGASDGEIIFTTLTVDGETPKTLKIMA